MKKMAVLTATRAEFGLLLPIINALRKYECDDLRVELIVTGTHLDERFGHTVDEIRDRGCRIDHEINLPMGSANAVDISNTQAGMLIKLTKLFLEENYSSIILLGDRYEMLSAAIAAGNTGTPIFHICGGDTTEGAIDEWIRHSITKMSYLHFVTNEESRKRVIQLGESPDRVFNFGSTSIDNIIRLDYMSRDEAMGSVGLHEGMFAVCTYHPCTIDGGDNEKNAIELLKAIEEFQELQFVMTKANADEGGDRINRIWDEAAQSVPNVHVYASLGVIKYLSIVKYAEFVIGNSSSGIIEAPALKVPTVNIGDRQRGRLLSPSVINCAPDAASIVKAIKTVMSREHKDICRNVVSPYGDGNSADKIAEKCVAAVKGAKIDLKKVFYSI